MRLLLTTLLALLLTAPALAAPAPIRRLPAVPRWSPVPPFVGEWAMTWPEIGRGDVRGYSRLTCDRLWFSSWGGRVYEGRWELRERVLWLYADTIDGSPSEASWDVRLAPCGLRSACGSVRFKVLTKEDREGG